MIRHKHRFQITAFYETNEDYEKQTPRFMALVCDDCGKRIQIIEDYELVVK